MLKNCFGQRLGLAVLTAALAAGGCQKTLFSQADPYNQARIRRYWDDDSAKASREARQRASDMGFGFSTGGGEQ